MFDWGDAPDRGVAYQGFGHYHEEYEKGPDDRWRIKVIRLTRLRVNRVPHVATEDNEVSLSSAGGR
jgi:hypothetical protein